MEWAATLILLLVVFISCHLFISFKRQQLHERRLPPGPTPLPLIGNLLQIKPTEVLKSLLKLREKYGPVFTVYFGPHPVLVLCGHQAVKEALIDKAEEFSGRTTTPSILPSFEGYGVSESNGARWKEIRRFTLTVLRSFGMGKKSIEQRIQEEAQFMVEEFRKTKENPFDPTFLLSRLFSNIICSICFGKRFDYEDKEFQTLVVMVNKFVWEMSTSWAQFYNIYANYLNYIPGIYNKMYDCMEGRLLIAKRIKKNQETFDPNFPRDYIDCFLIQMEKEKDNPDSEYNMKNLESNILSLLIGGTEPGSSTFRYGFLFLMKYPEVQGVVVVVCTKWQGITVYAILSTVLHDPTMFKSPNAFNPENFLDENGCFKKNDAFVPFSAGKRNCLGEALALMELFLFFTTILQNFQLKSLIPPEDIDLTPQMNGLGNIPPFYHLCAIPH